MIFGAFLYKFMKKALFFILLSLFITERYSYSQEVDFLKKDIAMTNIRNKLISLIEIESLKESDLEDLIEASKELIDKPLDINSLREEDLEKVFFLSNYQRRQFFIYRASLKEKFDSVKELKMIPSWDEETLSLISAFFNVKNLSESHKN